MVLAFPVNITKTHTINFFTMTIMDIENFINSANLDVGEYRKKMFDIVITLNDFKELLENYCVTEDDENDEDTTCSENWDICESIKNENGGPPENGVNNEEVDTRDCQIVPARVEATEATSDIPISPKLDELQQQSFASSVSAYFTFCTKSPFQIMIDKVKNSNFEIICEGITEILQYLTGLNPNIDDIIYAECLPIFVKCLEIDDEKLKFEVASILTNISKVNRKYCKAVFDANVVVPFIHLLESTTNQKIKNQVLHVLNNIIANDAIQRDACIDYGLIPHLNNTLNCNGTDITCLCTISELIMNLHRYSKTQISLKLATANLNSLLKLFQYNGDSKILTNICWSIAYLAESGNEYIQLIIDEHILQHLIPLLASTEETVQLCALKAIGYISTGTSLHTQAILDSGGLQYMKQLLYNDNLVKDVCWILSNITASTEDQVHEIFVAGLMPFILDVLNSEKLDTQKEAAKTITNAILHGRSEHITWMLALDILVFLTKFLHNHDVTLIKISLDIIENMVINVRDKNDLLIPRLEADGGLERIVELQKHENNEIYEGAYRILDRLKHAKYLERRKIFFHKLI